MEGVDLVGSGQSELGELLAFDGLQVQVVDVEVYLRRCFGSEDKEPAGSENLQEQEMSYQT